MIETDTMGSQIAKTQLGQKVRKGGHVKKLVIRISSRGVLRISQKNINAKSKIKS